MTWMTYSIRTRETIIREYAVKAQSYIGAKELLRKDLEQDGSTDRKLVTIIEYGEEVE